MNNLMKAVGVHDMTSQSPANITTQIHTTMAHNITAMMTTAMHTTTESPHTDAYPEGWGYLAVAIAVVLFGSNFVPVKKFETGDGLFFQLISCMTIWVGGLVMNGIRHFPPFYPLAMLGGFFWCTGNILCVPIIKTIGLGQGICIWASLNLIAGWASGRFGLFGLSPEVPTYQGLNYGGVCLCMISAVVYMFIKTDVRPVESASASGVTESNDGTGEREPLLSNERGLMNESITPGDGEGTIFDRLPVVPKRILGTVMAIVAGIFFGVNFVPVIYIQDNYPSEKNQHGLNYVFAHFSGILVSSVVYFAIYCAVKRNRPVLYPSAILPAMLSGAMWAVADMGWFVANDSLSPAISFPIMTSVPAIVGALWGIFFKEIRGLRNFIVLLIAIVFVVSGSVLTGLSKRETSGGGNSTLHNSLLIG